MGKNPAWTSYVVWYFFVGGVAAGTYVLGALADLAGRDEDRRVAKVAYAVTFPLVLVCPILLTLDLGTPARTFNMFRTFRWQSPMSVGSWALLGFGLAAFLSLLLVLRDDAAALRYRRLLAVPGSLLGFFIASYTGVLLSTTNRPLWSGTSWIGPLFLVSACSTGIAALVLFLAHDRRARLRSVHLVAMAAEALLLGVFLLSLGPDAHLYVSGRFAMAFWGGVVGLGLALPLLIALLPRARTVEALAAILVLFGGFTLRYVLVWSGQV